MSLKLEGFTWLIMEIICEFSSYKWALIMSEFCNQLNFFMKLCFQFMSKVLSRILTHWINATLQFELRTHDNNLQARIIWVWQFCIYKLFDLSPCQLKNNNVTNSMHVTPTDMVNKSLKGKHIFISKRHDMMTLM